MIGTDAIGLAAAAIAPPNGAGGGGGSSGGGGGGMNCSGGGGSSGRLLFRITGPGPRIVPIAQTVAAVKQTATVEPCSGLPGVAPVQVVTVVPSATAVHGAANRPVSGLKTITGTTPAPTPAGNAPRGGEKTPPPGGHQPLTPPP